MDSHSKCTAADEWQELVFLNRVWRYRCSDGRGEIEADVRHARQIVRELGLEGDSKRVATPSVKRSNAEVIQAAKSSPPLEGAMVTSYRSLVMRLSYLAQDRPDLGYTASTLARAMKQPRQSDWESLKRAGRYLKGYPVGKVVYEPQAQQETLRAFCDSDHAGDPISRRSRSGMVVMWGRHLLKHGTAVQSTVSLSSGESEYYSMLRSASHGMGLRAVLADWGVHAEIDLLCDASAARGISDRQGLGKLRHLDVRHLWLQEKVKDKLLRVSPVHTSDNLADNGTKPLDEATMRRHLKGMRFETPASGSTRHRELGA